MYKNSESKYDLSLLLLKIKKDIQTRQSNDKK